VRTLAGASLFALSGCVGCYGFIAAVAKVTSVGKVSAGVSRHVLSKRTWSQVPMCCAVDFLNSSRDGGCAMQFGAAGSCSSSDGIDMLVTNVVEAFGTSS